MRNPALLFVPKKAKPMSKPFPVLVRRSPSHSVIAHVLPVPGGFHLLRLSPDKGAVPDVAHLLSSAGIFPDMQALRRAVIAAMKGPTGDTLDRILLSREACKKWGEVVESSAQRLAGIDQSQIPCEMARPISGGRLKIWVPLPDGNEISLVIEKNEWAWNPNFKK